MLLTFYLFAIVLVIAAAVVIMLGQFFPKTRLPALDFRDLWRWQGTVNRRRYAAVGVVGFAIKHNIDRAIAGAWFGRTFDIFSYWIPPFETLRVASLSRQEVMFSAVMIAVALPFIWIGVGMTLRRLRSANLPLWLVCFFFVPLLNVLFFLFLSIIPKWDHATEDGMRRGPAEPLVSDSILGSAAWAVGLTAPVGAAIVYLGAQTVGTYGFGVFVALPFCMGLASVMLHSRRRFRTVASCLAVSLVSVALVAALLFALAVEGLICLVMAVPLAAALAIIGGLAGFAIQRHRPGIAQAPSMMVLALVLPVGLIGAESIVPLEAKLTEVVTTIRINAPPETVWPNLVSFPTLAQSDKTLFRLGVAHPIRADIRGTGVGAIRECVFTTGTFVERVNIWEENRRMGFSVVSGADAMTEFSPYDIHPRHLDGYLVPEGAEFRLIPTADGATILEGRSWYRNAMWPAGYWQMWSDKILHDVHESVFEHIKQLSEAR